MTSRFRLVPLAGLLALAGCGDAFNAGPLAYTESARMTSELELGSKPKLQEAVRTALAGLYGDDPRRIKVPEGTGLALGGRRLASWVEEGAGEQARLLPLKVTRLDPDTWSTLTNEETGEPAVERALGGYSLYRQHCLHCHGITGDGAGPTAEFLYPRPRDYRKGVFKFTSTTTGAKPTRLDLRKTLLNGLAGTSMPAFEALMSPQEIEQVIDYVIFLSLRGETELGLIEEALIADEDAPEPIPADIVQDVARSVINKWTMAEGQVVGPPVRRVASTRDSIERGREMFLGRTPQKLECAGCHGALAQGNGPSFIDRGIFNKVITGGDGMGLTHWDTDQARLLVEEAIGERYEELAFEAEGHHHSLQGEAAKFKESQHLEPFESYLKKNMAVWKDGSFDDWGQPIRPANLNLGMYKGGRRPIDIYWRIAKGINGAKMPGHFPAVQPDQIWDLVNFVLALPYDPELLLTPGEPAAPGMMPPTPAVARR